jgi:hypothetical protein
MNWLSDNWKILFEGFGGAAAIALFGYLLRHWWERWRQPLGQEASLSAKAARVENSPVASGLGNTQNVNSPIFNVNIGPDAGAVSANAIMSAERAWVMVTLEWQKRRGLVITGSGNSGEYMNFAVQLICTNQGKTTAWIAEKRIRAVIVDTLPPEPDLDSAGLIPIESETLPAGYTSVRDEDVTADGLIGAAGKYAVVYGIVRYKDVFGANHHTTFGYRLPVGPHLMERISGFPKYNENT